MPALSYNEQSTEIRMEEIIMLGTGFFGETLIDDFFDDFARPSRNVARYRTSDISVMKTDVQELDKGYEIDIELPGYKKEDVKAELKDGYMVITANHTSKDGEQNNNYIRRERFWGTCSRSFYVGEDIKQQDIKAKFEDGILKLYVPKKEEAPKVETNNFINIEG
jgi:HSP20 family molecular chaperone IbpA